jgi:hypothetical protein
MKFSIGDSILLRTTGEEGIVTGYISADMLEVTVQGICFPVFADDIDHPYLKWFSEKKQQTARQSPDFIPPAEPPTQRTSPLTQGLYLSFLPIYEPDIFEDVVQQLKIFLINELPQPIGFSYHARKSGRSLFQLTGSLQARGHLYLHTAAMEDVGQMRIEWQATPDKTPQQQGLQGKLQIKPARLFAQIAAIQQKNEPSFQYLLTDTLQMPLPAQSLKSLLPSYVPPKASPKIIRSVAHLELPRYEIDLHIEQLIDSKRGLTNDAIFQLQLKTLHHYLHLSIAHKQDRMVIIHGIGKGKLRAEVHQILRETPEVKHFVNEWHGRYGFGATEVFFEY